MTDIKKGKNTDIEKIKDYMTKLGFICDSYPSSQNLIYSKDEDVIIIKNNKKQL